MRIISQNGDYDINYDNTDLIIVKGDYNTYIKALLRGEDKSVIIGKYENHDKALMILNKIRNTHDMLTNSRFDGVKEKEYITDYFYLPKDE